MKIRTVFYSHHNWDLVVAFPAFQGSRIGKENPGGKPGAEESSCRRTLALALEDGFHFRYLGEAKRQR